ncbi:MAG: methyltransferase domain-containing protein [Methylococcaceae bacterium]|nr:methyltransferase domain-containing protein [Methylococcaceae bacterium]
MIDLKTKFWDESYARGENHIYYPKDETVKFLNRFVRKKNSVDTYVEKIEIKTGNALDYGCGVGRQTILLSEFGFNAFGLDLSPGAIQTSNELKNKFEESLKISFTAISDPILHFDDDFFDFGICDSVLDSMNFEVAKKLIQEFDRTTSQLFFITLITAEVNNNIADDQVVDTLHEKGTIQSYYDIARVKELLSETNWKIKWLNTKKEFNEKNVLIDSRFHIVLEK